MKIKTVIAGMFALAGILCWGDDIQYETVNGLTWSYTVYDGSATVYGGSFEEWDDEEGGYVEAFYPAIPDGTSGAIVVPSRLGGYPVTAIGDGAFCECHKLTSVTIPAGVVTIGEEAFTDCESMVGVTLPEGLQSIGDDAFDGCGKLRSVTLPESLTSIGSRAFDDCASLPSIRIPPKVKTVGYHSFARDYGLKTVEVPERLRAQITDNAVFYKCSPKITYYSSIPVITFDANGGKIGSQAKILLACEEENDDVCLYITPEDPVKAGVDFDGWWTAKDGGVQVQFGDVVDLSVFANAKTPTLYAQWRIAHKITVSGGVLTGEPTVTTTKGGLYRGDEVGVFIDDSKLYDNNENEVNAFANWTYTPATVNLGTDFDPFSQKVKVSMPNADVKLTANFVNGFAAYLTMGYYQSGEAPEGDFYWSVDNGKTLIPFGNKFPVKAGKIKVKFYDKTGNWRASDMEITVDKRGTYKEDGVTYYEDPWDLYREAKFVPVNDSMKIKLDANGGAGTREDFFAYGCEYLSYPTPYRKGYAFAGWWTAKDGGKLITTDMIFDPADFAGQKTPTLYAHWLQFRKLTMKDESAVVEWHLDAAYFGDDNMFTEIMNGLAVWYPESSDGGYLEGKGVLELLPGTHVSRVSVDAYSSDKNGNELSFQKWMVSPSTVNLGPSFRITSFDTEFMMPDADVTLQATYVDELTCWRLSAVAEASAVSLGYDEGREEYVTIKPPYDAFEWSPDGGKTWYKAGNESSQWVDDGEDGGYWEGEFGEAALLKTGTYTVIWRSTDPNWQAPTTKSKAIVEGCRFCGSGSAITYGTFTYVPQVVVDVMTFENGELTDSPVGGTVTMNPKDGLVPVGKTIALAAKAAKNYVFQGWAFKKSWEYGDDFRSTLATWKLENESTGVEYNEGAGDFIEKWLLESNIDPDDEKVHVVAVFKAIGSYSVDDMGFTCVATGQGGSYNVSDNVVDVNAVVGCAVEDSLCCVPATYPLSYKLDGKLPDGLKFDAKTGVLSGVPKKVGNSTVKIVASDPAKNSKGLTVNISVKSLPSWLVGDYRGLADEGSDEVIYHGSYYHNNLLTTWYPWSGLNGLLELSVKSDGKVSGKVVSCLGSGSVSGTLIWRDPACSYGDESKSAEYGFYSYGKDAYCYISFCSDGTISGDVGAFNQQYFSVHGKLTGLRQNKDLLADSGFIDKYYTFAFCPETTEAEARWDEDLETWVTDKAKMQSGYGYLTVKTDKNGTAKVIGQLPDGEKVSMSALVMPVSTNGSVRARLHLFASPSSYKKEDWFVMMLNLNSDGSVESEERSAWTIPATSAYKEYYYGDGDGTGNAKVFGEGTLYSEAKTLEGYYWAAFCEYSDQVRQQYSYKEDGWTYYDDEWALDVGYGFFFNVAVKGDSKGTISLVEKSPAPWVQDGGWNYWEDKKGNEITDPSQLSISFTKATGIFTGKVNVYFDDPKPTSASLPYSGVMIYNGEGGYEGFGSAVYTYKYSYEDCDGKAKSDTKKVTLPVSLEPPL